MRNFCDNKIRTFTDLIAWQEAHKLTLLVYNFTQSFPALEKYNLTSQMRRAVVSIESCIAEGFCRFHYKERLNFYYDARGSIGEIESQAIDAKDLSYLTSKDYRSIFDQAERTNVVLGGLIRQTEVRSAK